MPVFCPTCGASFATEYLGRRHANRQVPCSAVLARAPATTPSPSRTPERPPQPTHTCEYCSLQFTSRQGKSRHKRFHCRDAIQSHDASTVELDTSRIAGAVVWTQNNYNVTIHVHVRGYNPMEPIIITREMIGRMFAHNASAQEFLRLQAAPGAGYAAHADTSAPELPRLITDMCMDLIEQYHADPENRNCWLNRASRDQIITVDATGGKKKNTVEAQLSEFMSAVAGQITTKVKNEYPAYYHEFGLEVVTALAAIPCWLRDPSPKIRLQLRPRFITHMDNMAP